MIQNIVTAAIMNLQVQREFYLSLNYFTRILLDLSLILAFPTSSTSRYCLFNSSTNHILLGKTIIKILYLLQL